MIIKKGRNEENKLMKRIRNSRREMLRPKDQHPKTIISFFVSPTRPAIAICYPENKREHLGLVLCNIDLYHQNRQMQ